MAVEHHCRTWHEIFESSYAPYRDKMRFREWRDQIFWPQQIEAYISLKWALIPISYRSKLPVQPRSNYLAHASRGPYLTKDQALWWIREADSNIACVSGPSNLLWADFDNPQLPYDFMLEHPLVATPRGFCWPLKRDGFSSQKKAKLEHLGFDFRRNYNYELCPVSTTCAADHGLRGKPHPKPTEPCCGGSHRYFVREWLCGLDHPILSFSEFYKEVTS